MITRVLRQPNRSYSWQRRGHSFMNCSISVGRYSFSRLGDFATCWPYLCRRGSLTTQLYWRSC